MRISREGFAIRTVAATMIGAALVAAVLWPAPGRAAGCSVPLFAYHTGIVVLSEGGRVSRVRVQIADTSERQEVGLMCRSTLDPDTGMLFVFPASTGTAFWMKNTLIPLAIAFIDANWHVIRIMEMTVASDPLSDDPRKFPLYDPHRPYRYALEVNAGFFTTHGLSERAEVRFLPQESGMTRPHRIAIGPP